MENKQKFRPNPEARLLDQVREVLRYHHYAYRTEQTYCEWIVRYVKFHKARKHPREMGKTEIEAFLSHLATHGNVAVSTQRQAMHALLFLYQQVLDMPMNDEISPIKARRNKRPPIVLTQAEVQAVLAQMSGVHSLMASILYGGDLRLMECIRMRTQDIDFHRSKIYVRDGKGGKDRVALLPLSCTHNCVRISARSGNCMSRIWRRVTPRSTCRTRSPGNIHRLHESSAGSTCSLPKK